MTERGNGCFSRRFAIFTSRTVSATYYACLCTGCICVIYRAISVVAFCRNFFLCNNGCVTYATVASLGKTCLGTCGFYCCVNDCFAVGCGKLAVGHLAVVTYSLVLTRCVASGVLRAFSIAIFVSAYAVNKIMTECRNRSFGYDCCITCIALGACCTSCFCTVGSFVLTNCYDVGMFVEIFISERLLALGADCGALAVCRRAYNVVASCGFYQFVEVDSFLTLVRCGFVETESITTVG